MTVEIVPIERRHIAGSAKWSTAWPASGAGSHFIEAPPLPRVRRVVQDNLRNGVDAVRRRGRRARGRLVRRQPEDA